MKIRFGVLGCSRVAKKAAIPALLASEHVELAAIGSRDQEKARIWAKEFHVSSGTYEEILSDPNIDAVYISLPNTLHEEWTIRAAQAGKHIWCEKPAALSFAGAKRMVEACRKNNVRLIEGFTFLSHPQHARARELMQDIGELRSFEGRFCFPMPETGSALLDPKCGGGSYFDSAVYPIRAATMLFGEPEYVHCTLLPYETGVDRQADVLFTYANGRTAHAASAFGSYFQSTYSVLGSSGKISLERAYAVPKELPVKIFIEKDDAIKEIAIPPADQFRLMLEEFCIEVRSGTASTRRYEDELLAQSRILEAGRIADAEKRAVRVSEIM